MDPKLIINHNISSKPSKEDQLREKVDGFIETVDELLEMNKKMKKELKELKNMI